MKVKDFRKVFNNLRSDLDLKEIIIIAPNGIEFEPKIKLIPKDYDFSEVEKVVITYE